MAAKYEPQENEMPEQVNEPIAAYQRTASDMSLYIPTEYEREIIMRSEKDQPLPLSWLPELQALYLCKS